MSAATTTTEEKEASVLWSTGRRKTSTARVRLFPNGKGKITINGRKLEVYCYHEGLVTAAIAPLITIDKREMFDFKITVSGGGPTGQAGAISHGLARALEKFNPEWRIPLKRAGHLKRDPRQKERKKAGQPGARKRFQFSKR